METKLRSLAFGVALLLAGAGSACAEEAVAVLHNPQRGEALAPDGVMSFAIAGDVSDAQFNSLYVQFDGYDVTQMVRVDGRTVSFQSPTRLQSGDHTLRVLEQVAGGKFVERQNWTIRVAGEGMKDASVSGSLDAMLSARVADNLHGSQQENRLWGQGNLSANAVAGAQDWDVQARVNSFYDSVSENNPDTNNLELGEYLVTARHFHGDLSSRFSLGNHDAGISNLLIDRFYRRGASATLNYANTVELTGFSQDPARAYGNSNPAGVAHDDQLASGVNLRLYPVPSSDKRVFVESSLYTGDGTLQGNGSTVADDFSNRGHGWAVAAGAQSMDDKANLRGDYAHSTYDADGSGSLLRSEDAHAQRVRFMYAPLGNLQVMDANAKQWVLTALYQRTGTFFRALTNSSLPQDERRFELSSNYQHDTLSLASDAYVVQNNTDALADLPTDRSYGGSSQLSFSPIAIDSALDPQDWFTYSNFTAGMSFNHDGRLDTPFAYAGDKLNQRLFSANAGWSATFSKATLSLNHTYSDFADFVTASNGYKDNLSALSLTYTPNERFTVTPAIQYESNNPAFADDWTKTYLSLDTTTVLIPDKLTHNLHFAGTVDNGSSVADQYNVSTDLTWQIRQAQRNHPGYALVASGYYQNQGPISASAAGSGLSSGSDYKVYLQLRISAPFGF